MPHTFFNVHVALGDHGVVDLRGKERSSQPLHVAADEPSNTKNSVYIRPRVEIFQSQLVVNNSWKKPTSGPHLIVSFNTQRLRQRQPKN